MGGGLGGAGSCPVLDCPSKQGTSKSSGGDLGACSRAILLSCFLTNAVNDAEDIIFLNVGCSFVHSEHPPTRWGENDESVDLNVTSNVVWKQQIWHNMFSVQPRGALKMTRAK